MFFDVLLLLLLLLLFWGGHSVTCNEQNIELRAITTKM